MEVAGNGYINIRLDRGAYGAGAAARRRPREPQAAGEKIIVEHTNINPNKAAHIGHLRNADPGRHLRAHAARRAASASKCRTTSTTPACRWRMSWSGFHYLEKKTPAEVRALIADAAVASTTSAGISTRAPPQYYKEHPEALAWRAETLHAIEAGEGELAELAHLVADAIVQGASGDHAAARTSSTTCCRARARSCTCKFWAAAFELLKERKAIYFETEGKNSGCWVMPAAAFSRPTTKRKTAR